MKAEITTAKYILVGCEDDALTSGDYKFTHTLTPYAYRTAKTADGKGERVAIVKINAPALLDKILGQMTSDERREARIFMGGDIDPYCEQDQEFHLTRELLQVFTKYPDIDLLVIQTSSAAAAVDLRFMKDIPYLWLSAAIDTEKNFSRLVWVVNEASRLDIKTQVAIRTQTIYNEVFYQDLASDLRACAWKRAIVIPGETESAIWLYKSLKCTAGRPIAWNEAGICNIAPRHTKELPMLIQMALFGFEIGIA